MVAFSVANPSYGNWSGPTLSVTGGGAGVTQVIATNGTLMASAKLTVHVNGSRDDGTVPPGTGGMFDNATESGTGPTIAYPANGVIVPPNLGQFDVHWQPAASQNLFEISLQNQYVNLKIHRAATGPAYSAYLPAEWTAVASTAEPITLTVSGMNSAAPATKSTSMPEMIGTTNEIVQGGLYYWTTSSPQGIYRYDMSTPGTPPSSFFPPNMAPGGGNNCIGCHTLSKDGTKIAMTIDSGDGRGAMFDVGDRSILIPFDTNTQRWNFATFNTDNTKLVTVSAGQMVLRDCGRHDPHDDPEHLRPAVDAPRAVARCDAARERRHHRRRHGLRRHRRLDRDPHVRRRVEHVRSGGRARPECGRLEQLLSVVVAGRPVDLVHAHDR